MVAGNIGDTGESNKVVDTTNAAFFA